MASKSKFSIIPKEEMKEYGNMIMLKKISYSELLKHLKEEYTELGNITSEALRKFMILKKYVLNTKSFYKINRNIQNQQLAQKKRKIKLEALKEDILKDFYIQEKLLSDTKFITSLFDSPIAKTVLIKLIIEILEKK